ncbi:MAG: MmgE/PrpD family protein [Burkholderiales bacterium]|nr:MmgE/PrpD family protein [Burkholderiales bacterium]
MQLEYGQLPEHVVHDCKRRIIDTIGCGLGAFHAEPCRIARQMALRAEVENGALVLGTGSRTLPELAAFANGVMMRYLDGNDSYPGGGGHASDAISAIISVATAIRADGRAVITAVVAAYEVFHNLYKAARLREKGWDHVFYIAVASTAGVAKLLGLTAEQTANAIALSITPNLALEVTRRGKLSMWKGCAGGNASRNGVFAALLAAEGLTGPDKAIEGVHGLWHIAGNFEIAPFPGEGRPFRITRANLKFFLSEYHSQSPISAAIELHKRLPGLEGIRKITVFTYKFAQQEIGEEPEKWHPTTRETADHSLPYIIAAVLIDGDFSDAIFSDARLGDQGIHGLSDKIRVIEDPEMTRQFPEKIPCRIEVEMDSGEKMSSSIEYPRGHYMNPMTDDEVSGKFMQLAARAVPEGRAKMLLELLWKLQEQGSLDDIFQNARTR